MLPVKGDYYDLMRACFLGHQQPNPEMEKTMDNILSAWSYLRNGYSKFTTVEFLMADLGLARSQCYKLIQDSYQVFGNLEETSKLAIKLLYVENFKRLAKLAEQDQDYYTAGILFDKAAKIEGAFETTGELLVDPEDYKAPPIIKFSSNPKVFIRSQGVEDTEFEEVKDQKSNGTGA